MSVELPITTPSFQGIPGFTSLGDSRNFFGEIILSKGILLMKFKGCRHIRRRKSSWTHWAVRDATTAVHHISACYITRSGAACGKDILWQHSGFRALISVCTEGEQWQ